MDVRIRKTEELAVEILYANDIHSNDYYLKIERYVTYPKYKESISNQICFIHVDKKQADEIITALKLVAVEREDKTAINYRGKAWLKQQKYRESRPKK